MVNSLDSGSLEAADRPWHSRACDDVLSALSATRDGLSTEEAGKRLAQYGANVLDKKGGASVMALIWGQINNPLIWVLIGSAVIAMLVDPADGLKNGLVILAVVIINTIIGFAQEYKASKAIESLSAMVPEFATVQRDGKRVQLPVAELVPGDVVFLQSGDKVPADLRLFHLRTLQIEEAALTGESVPVEKMTDPVAGNATLGDRRNMAFSGSLVTYGTGLGVVTTTGNGTELGRINTMLGETTAVATPLSIALHKIGIVLTVGIAVISVVILFVGTARAMSEGGVDLLTGLRESVIFAITLAVGAIPEGLPAIVTIALAIGVQRMAARRAVVRKLPSVETLGSTTVICSDKTGTLTRNEMTVQALYLPGVGRVPRGGRGLRARRPPVEGGQPPRPRPRRRARTAAGRHPVLRRHAGAEGRPLADHRRPDRRRARDRRREVRHPHRASPQAPRPARHDPVRERQPVHGHAARGGRRGQEDHHQGRARGGAQALRPRGPDTAIRQVEAFASEGMRVLGFAEKRFDRAALDMEDCAAGLRVHRAAGHDRPAAHRGDRRHPRLPPGRHHGQDDHRRPHGHRPGHR